MIDGEIAFVHEEECFRHKHALMIYEQALLAENVQTVVIDLANATDATTSAVVRLVLLRRALRRVGRDLILSGLRDRTAFLYEINRLDAILPRA